MRFSLQHKMLPMLVAVAMIAFSVRLAAIITGFSELSSNAYAQDSQNTSNETSTNESASEVKSPEILSKKEEEQEKELTNEQNNTALKPDEGSKNIELPALPGKKTEELPQKEASPSTSEQPKPLIYEDNTAKAPEWKDAGDSEVDLSTVKMEMFQDLSERRKKLDNLEKDLNAKDALLKAAEQEIDRKYQELTKLKTEIEGLLGKQSEEEQKRVTSLVKVYEGMKPKDAARIFDTLDLDVLVAVMSKMSERKLAPVMAAMNPERARTVTIMLAEQKNLPTLPTSN